jgi:hypothetical protein
MGGIQPMIDNLAAEREEFTQSGPATAEPALPAVLNARHVQGWNEAIDVAVQHVQAQHVVWDNTPIPAHALLDLIAKNLAAFKIEA